MAIDAPTSQPASSNPINAVFRLSPSISYPSGNKFLVDAVQRKRV
jgi:hypothetical protein